MAKIEMSVTVTGTEPNEVVHCDDTTVAKGSSNTTLQWNMDTTGWEITALNGLPDTEFKQKQKKNDTGYTCTDKNDTEQNYAYTIVVAHTATGRQLQHDPTIRNGGN